MTDTLIENVSDTAFWVAYYRALESKRPDALFHDPFAGLLAGAHGEKIARSMPGKYMTAWSVVIRTCIIDDYIRFALAHGVDTVLNLGAGLDTRPYRMDLPSSLLWIEADYPHVIDFKQERLSNQTPRCRLERVQLDLANPSERLKLLSGSNARAQKILILTEGVVPYLTVQDVGSLADDLAAQDRAAYWVLEYFSYEALKFRLRMTRRTLRNAPFKFNPGDWLGFFAAHGWHCRELRYLAEEGERLQRPLRFPLRLKLILGFRSLFASRERRKAFRRFAAYIMLDRATPSSPVETNAAAQLSPESGSRA
ncbi:MAG TPA: SAM-dependent methyltransferase [Verrucomicrobiae bacterium]|nr:SAM-dependent methyltransferase [Verrucomicrobiae bacterium]